ncbi:MAG: glycosyltransferase [Streptosporangiaceae bacterium]
MSTTYALLSTYPPTQCGLANFAAALLLQLPQPGDHVAVVRVLDEPAPCPAREIVQDLVAGSAASAAAAVDVLNGFDVVIVQHEYGIYGGPDGQDVVSLLEALRDRGARFLPASALAQLIDAAALVLLPYDSREQVTSGVLIEAVTTGKPVVSTCFPPAVELLGGGAGLLVGRQDPAGIARAPHRVLTDPGLAARLSRCSAELAPQLLWPAVARCYRELASSLTTARAGAPA